MVVVDDDDDADATRAWRAWTHNHVGPEKALQLLIVLERPKRRAEELTKAEVKRLTWASIGSTKAKSSELLALVKGIEARTLHERIIKVNDVPYLTVNVAVDEYIARSLLTAGQVGKNKGRGFIVRTNATHAVIAAYRSDEDSRPAGLVEQFVSDYLGNALKVS